MINKYDLGKTKQKFTEFWNMENHDRPLISICAPKDGYRKREITEPSNITERWIDTGYIIEKAKEDMRSTYYCGEAFPSIFPNLGPDFFSATLGCDLIFGEDTSWSVPLISSWADVERISFDEENKWWMKMLKMTEDMCSASDGDYLVGITDIHPGFDALVALRGPEMLCMDLYDHPQVLMKTVFEIYEIFKKQFESLHSLISKYQFGCTNWMGIWHPDKWYVSQCDFSGLISHRMFNEFILPELIEELHIFGNSIYHLDGPAALIHIDTLLSLPEIDGIQWVYGAGQPTASHWIPLLKKIQDAGKCIQVSIQPEELDFLLNTLKPEGVMYCTSCETQSDAEELIKKAERHYERKLY